MRAISIAIVLLPFAVSAFAGDSPPTRNDAISEALTAIKMRERDLSVLSLNSDPFRLPIVDTLMDKPLRMPEFLDSKGCLFTNPDREELDILYEAARLMNTSPTKPIVKSVETTYPWKDKKEIPVRLREALDIIFAAFEQAEVSYDAAFTEVDSFQMDTILTWGLPYLIREETDDFEEEDDNPDLIESDKAELESEKRTERLFLITSKIDRSRLANAALTVLNAAIGAEGKISGLTVQSNGVCEVPDTIASGDVVFWCETERGPVIIGGPKQTIYNARFAAIIDIGGDDIYTVAAGGADTTVQFAICIDLSGDDIYSSGKTFAFGSGGVGVGVLIDADGDDSYISDDFALASGSYGSGILIDRGGDDTYSGDIGSQGAAFMGFGMLLDYEGHDRYSARLYSQGFGYVGGFGMIAEFDGNDSYTAQGAYVDRVRYADHHLSLSQGFGYGNRPDWSGGIGLLLDANGNDVYTSDIFGQGASYWLAFGGLWDADGNDIYVGYQYSQGAGTHLCAAMLYDKGGGDTYTSHGVSQGCGHDLAVGYLLDGGKNDDNYTIWDLSQGAGNANGVGIFIDEGGNDGYVNKKDYNVQGYGNWRRDFGSIGIMIDISGEDRYSGKGEDSSWWSSGRYGIGIDFPATVPDDK